MKGAEILTKFTADDSDLKKTIKNVSGIMSGLSGGLIGMFASGMKTSVKLLTEALKSSVSAYAEMEQLSGGAKKIFDEMDYSKIEKDATKAYKTMNMSAKEYLSVINTVGANFASTLGDEKGYEVAKQGLQAISDFATGTGLDINKLSTSFQTIAKSTQSYQRVSAQFAGILPTTSAEFLKQAQEVGLLSKEYKKLTEVPVAEYQQALTEMMTRGTKSIGLENNTFKESTETLTGSILALKSSWDNFLSGVGDTKTVVETALVALKQIGKGIIKMLPTVTNGIVDLLNGLIPLLPGLIKELFPPLLNGAILLLQGLIDQLPTFLKMIADMLPTIIQSLIDGFAIVTKELAKQAPILIPMVVEAILDALLTMTEPENIDTMVDCGEKLIIGVADGLIKAIPELVKRVPQITSAIFQAFKDQLPRADKIGFNLGEKLGKSTINGAKKILGIKSPSKEFALIGKYTIEGYTDELDSMSGEVDKQVRETFMPTLEPNINPILDSTIGSMLASSPTTNVTINNSMQFDALGQLVNDVKTFSGGAKNDYNYVGGY